MNASQKADELAVPFMVAEFETPTSRILALQKTRATRVTRSHLTNLLNGVYYAHHDDRGE